VRDPKWKHDRVTMFPASISAELGEQLIRAAALNQEDLKSCCSSSLSNSEGAPSAAG